MKIADEFISKGWSLAHTIQLPPRTKELFSVADLILSPSTKKYLTDAVPSVYQHQKEAIRAFLSGAHVCMTTGTASGKSLPFYVAGIEQLSKNPGSRVIAIYPMKALGYEQEERWKKALKQAGLNAHVGCIDGQVPSKTRLEILRRSQVLILTPDIIHAWLLNNVGEKAVLGFLKQISLIVVDEVHTYTGVFGSNGAFLFRRLQHALSLLGANPQYFCASATISAPENHLTKLLGVNFHLIGSEFDTSPKHRVNIQLVTPSPATDLLSQVSELLKHLAEKTSSKFIAFVDSRKQAEHLSSILARTQEPEKEDEDRLDFDYLQRLNVLPFRSGYEEHDRNIIQERLKNGTLRGVISTSALELGMDISALETGILVGVPRSSTSLFQRIGRIGRHSDGDIIVINTGSIYDEAIFKNPQDFLNRPMAESSLYLENTRIQYLHALCLARQGGEHDRICAAQNKDEAASLLNEVVWPHGFMELCRQERLGEVPTDLQSMKAEAGEDPNHVYPLRDVESQFKIILKQGPIQEALGSVSYGQLMREAYPGAIYYYISQPFRIYQVLTRSKEIHARREKSYTTQPQSRPTLVFPNLAEGNIYQSKVRENLIAAECSLQIRESLCGFKERRGPNESQYSYPMLPTTGIRFNLSLFTRNFFTTGVILTHPALSREGVNCEVIASLFYEAFMMLIPFERQDINFAVDKHRAQREGIAQGSKFIALYDQTYGSLRLSGRIMEDNWLEKTFQKAVELCEDQESSDADTETLTAIKEICRSAKEPEAAFSFGHNTTVTTPQDCERVVLPGSQAMKINDGPPEEYEVEDVFFHPAFSGLSYRGRRVSLPGEANKSIVPLNALAEIPGETKFGFYNYNTGEITPV